MNKFKLFFLFISLTFQFSNATDLLFKTTFDNTFPTLYDCLTYIDPDKNKVLVEKALTYSTAFSGEEVNWKLDVLIKPTNEVDAQELCQGCKLSIYSQISTMINAYIFPKMVERVIGQKISISNRIYVF